MDSIEARQNVERVRHEIEQSRGTWVWKDYVNALRLIADVVFTRASGFILELVQNAEDAGRDLDTQGAVTISVSHTRLKFEHNGRLFTVGDLEAICGIRSSKKPERGTLGYLGIGFKSTFNAADRVEVYSGHYSFKFDRTHHEWITSAQETPWHVIPVWIDTPSESVSPDATTIIVRFRDDEARARVASDLRLLSAQLFLFLKWLKTIRIENEMDNTVFTLENLGEDDNETTTLARNGETERYRFFRKEVSVPKAVASDRLSQSHRENVTKREIAIAFSVDKWGNLFASPSGAMYGGVYSFVPLGEERSGVKFPIQADFLVQPGRDAINASAVWNRWLVDEITALCFEAIEIFRSHELWKFQYLTVFEFDNAVSGNEAYEKLFLPGLINKINAWMDSAPCVMSVDLEWMKRSDVVQLAETQEATDALVDMQLVARGELADVLGGRPGLRFVHPKAAAAQAGAFPKADRWSFLANSEYIVAQSGALDAPSWFRRLYEWLRLYPIYEEYFYYKTRTRVLRYHDNAIVLTSEGRVVVGGEVDILDVDQQELKISEIASKLDHQRALLHPEIISSVLDEKERTAIKGFLTGHLGVQLRNATAICRTSILPMIETRGQAPAISELVSFTQLCMKYLPAAELKGKEIWVVTKSNSIRRARETFFSTEFAPEKNWERHEAYLPEIEFLSALYIQPVCTPDEIHSWFDFFRLNGVRTPGTVEVEIFAENFVKHKLESRVNNITPVDKQNLGYDFVADDNSGEKVYLEIKGQSIETDVDLTPNEAQAAHAHGSSYWLCIVAQIPEYPVLYRVEDPDKIGRRSKVTVPAADWKQTRWLETSS